MFQYSLHFERASGKGDVRLRLLVSLTTMTLNMPARVLQFFVPVGNAEFVDAIGRPVAFDIEDRRAVEKIQAADI